MNSRAAQKRTGILLAVVAGVMFSFPFLLNYMRGGASGVGYDPKTQGSPLFFAATYPASVAQGPLDGRLVVVVSRQKEIEPRLLIRADSSSAQVFGMDVAGWYPGRAVEIHDAVQGFPLPTVGYFRPGYYWVQGLFYRYETVRRAGSPQVQLPAWQQSWVMVSRPVEVYLDPRSDDVIRVDLARTLLVESDRPSGDQVVRLKSAKLSAFWGREVFLEAAVDLPEGWSEGGSERYPLIVRVGGGDPEQSDGGPVVQDRSTGSAATGTPSSSDAVAAPNAIVATLIHPAPNGWRAFDSENFGPWGEALTEELIPEIERRFRGEGRTEARAVVGANADGWQALWLALAHPGVFGATWSVCPGPVDLHDFMGVDLYEDANAYTDGRRGSENHLESVLATRSRSGRPWDVWQSEIAPLRADGYPSAIWDKRSGKIDLEVATQVRERYDLTALLDHEWKSLALRLVGGFNVIVGSEDLADSQSATSRLGAMLRAKGDTRFANSVRVGDFVSCSSVSGDPFRDGAVAERMPNDAQRAADALLPVIASRMRRR